MESGVSRAAGPKEADQWSKLVQIHNHAKSVFLCAEEFDHGFKDFIQPVMELRNAFEHIIRAKAAELGMNPENGTDPAEYSWKSFDKAIGHEYRAFFDAADWFSVIIRDRIINSLDPYSHECISDVIPNYYPELRPVIEKTCREIAAIRGAKDIAKGQDLLAEIEKYRQAVDTLLETWGKISDCIPALVDWRKKHRRSAIWTWVFGALVGGTIVATFGKWILISLGLAKP